MASRGHLRNEIAIRPATVEDSAEIARLFLISSHGLAAYIWSRLAEPGETVEQAGARRYARTGVAFSYENCLMAVAGERIVGMAHAFPMDRDPDAAPEADPVLRPYGELEDYGSLYISSMAVRDGWRDRGIGRRLIEAMDARACALGRPRLSLICLERNAGAMRLYLRLGFSELMRRSIVPHETLEYCEGDALLMARPVGASADNVSATPP
jgi:GNAT superfamily N-acetyltransferase